HRHPPPPPTRRAPALAPRTSIANIATIAAAESAWSIRTGSYNTTINAPYVAGPPPSGGLVGAPEGLSAAIFCPLDSTTPYVTTVDRTGTRRNSCHGQN